MTKTPSADTLLAIPFRVSATEYILTLVLQEHNLERMRAYDPIELPLNHFRRQSELRLKDIIVTFATAEEVKEIERLAKQGEIRDALRMVTRGWAYRPERGDHDGPPLRLEHDG